MQLGAFVEPGQSIKLTNAFRFGVNTFILRQAGFKPVHKTHEDRSPEWAANATVEVTDADFAGQEEEASLSLIFRDISFDSIYLNLDAFLNSKITKEITLFHHGGTNQVGTTNWSTLTNRIQYTINPAVTNEIKFTNVHISSKGFVRVTINHTNFSPINIVYEGLKDGDNVTKLISGNSDPALSASPSFPFIPKKATLTIKPDFNWTTNDYTGLTVSPLPGVTNKPTSFVYELTPFKQHTFEFTGAGLKTNEFTVGPYKPSTNYTTNIDVELEDELAKEWTRHKGEIEKTKGLAPGTIAKYKKILEDAKSDIVKANGKLSELYKENEITIVGSNLKNDKTKFLEEFDLNATYKKYFKEFGKNWIKEVDEPYAAVDDINTQPSKAKLEKLKGGIDELKKLRTKTANTFAMAKVKFQKVAEVENNNVNLFIADNNKFTKDYNPVGHGNFEKDHPKVGESAFTDDPLKFLEKLNASQKRFDVAYQDALKNEYNFHAQNINLLEKIYNPKGPDKFPDAELRNQFEAAAQDKIALEAFIKIYRPKYKAQYQASIKRVKDHWRNEIGLKKAQFNLHAPLLIKIFTDQIDAINVKGAFLANVIAEPRPGAYVEAMALEKKYDEAVGMLAAELKLKINDAIGNENMDEAWELNDDFQAAFPGAIRPWKAKLTCVIQIVPRGGDIQIKIPVMPKGVMMFVGGNNLKQNQLLPPDKYPVDLKYMIDGLPVEYKGPVLMADRPFVKISLIQVNNLMPPRPQIIMGDKITGPFRRMNLKGGTTFSELKVGKGRPNVLLAFDNVGAKAQFWKDLMKNDFLSVKDAQGKLLGEGNIFSKVVHTDNHTRFFFLLELNGKHAPAALFKKLETKTKAESTLPLKEQPAKP